MWSCWNHQKDTREDIICTYRIHWVLNVRGTTQRSPWCCLLDTDEAKCLGWARITRKHVRVVSSEGNLKTNEQPKPQRKQSQNAWGNPHVRGTQTMHHPQNTVCSRSPSQLLTTWAACSNTTHTQDIIHVATHTQTPTKDLITRLLPWETLCVTCQSAPKGTTVYLPNKHFRRCRTVVLLRGSVALSRTVWGGVWATRWV